MEEILSSIRRIIADEETEEGGAGATNDDAIASTDLETEQLDTLEVLDDDDDDDDGGDVLELTSVVEEAPPADEDTPEIEDIVLDDDDKADTASSGGLELVDDIDDDDDGDEIEIAEIDDLPQVGNLADDDLTEDDSAIAAFESPTPLDEDDMLVEDTNVIDTTTIQEDEPAVSTKKAETEALLSTGTASTTTGAFAKLSKAFRPTPVEESVADGAGRTVEQFIEDMARPMLKEWLDENMPAIVERLVQKEIQKIARRAELL